MLNLLGVDLSDRLMSAAADNNETGFWEHQGVVNLHEDLLDALDFRWDDPRALPQDFTRCEALSGLEAHLTDMLRKDFKTASLWGLKDPRMCRTLPFWRPVFRELNSRPAYVILLRNPVEVANSLHRRDGLSLGTGLLLWLRHMIEAEQATRGADRVFLRYDELLADWQGALAGVDKALGVTWSRGFDDIAEEVAGFLDPSLRHHRVPSELLSADESISHLVRDAYAAFCAAVENKRSNLSKSIDRIAAILDDIGPLYDDVLGDTMPTIAQLRRRVLELERTVMERDDRIRDRDGRIAERDSRIAERDSLINERDSRVAERDTRIAERDSRIAELRTKIDQTTGENTLLIDEVNLAKADVEQLRQSTSWRVTAPLRFAGEAIRKGPHTVGRLWWLNPLSWLLMPVWLLVQVMRFPTRTWVHLRRRPHELSWSPTLGVHEHAGGWFTIDGPVGIFALHSERHWPARLPSFAIIECEIESEDSLVRAWLTKGGKPSVDPETAIPLPLKAGRHRFYSRINGPLDALWIEPTRTDKPNRARLRTLKVIEVGAIWILVEKLRRFASVHGASPSAWFGLVRRVVSRGLGGTARDILDGADSNIGLQQYQAWIGAYDTLSKTDLAAIQARIGAMAYRPKLSLIMPTYNTPTKWLRRVLDSVLDQLYPDWELCIADDASPKAQVRAVLKEYADKDPRIKLVFRESNGHISRASNSAIEIATGDFIVLLDHDDELPPHALYMVAEEINAHPNADVIYSDEDKIDEAGQRSAPYFKSQYNPDLFLSHNMISHLGVYRTSLVRDVGGFRPEFDGSQDYDLALRVIERTTPERIRHIPHVLYHWRTIPGSVALSGDQKEYAHIKAREAIQSHLDRTGKTDATVEPTFNGNLHRVNYPLPDPAPRVSIIIPTRNAKSLLQVAVESCLDKTRYPDFEILIVDNQSDEPDAIAYLEHIALTPGVRILPYAKPFNFADMNNVAASEATGSVLCFLNNDTEVIREDWLEHMVSHALRPEIGAVGAKLYFPDDTLQHAGIVLVPAFIAWHAFSHFPRAHSGFFGRAILQQNYSAVTAACMVVRRELFERVDGFDAETFAVSYNDVDFCLHLNAEGFRTFWTPFAELYHYQSASLGKPKSETRVAQFEIEAAAFRERWGHVIADDPCYSPNLTDRLEDFSLAFPPRVTKPWRSVKDEGDVAQSRPAAT